MRSIVLIVGAFLSASTAANAEYVKSDPINNVDPTGEETVTQTQTAWVGLIYGFARSTNQTVEYHPETGAPIAMGISRTISNGIGLGAGVSQDISYCASCTIDDVISGDSVSFAVDVGVAGFEGGFIRPSDGDRPGLASKNGDVGGGTGPGAGFSMLLDETEAVAKFLFDPIADQWQRVDPNGAASRITPEERRQIEDIVDKHREHRQN